MLGECCRHQRTGLGEGGVAVARRTNPTCELYNRQREWLGSGIPVEASALGKGPRQPWQEDRLLEEEGELSLYSTELSIILSYSLEWYQTSGVTGFQDMPKTDRAKYLWWYKPYFQVLKYGFACWEQKWENPHKSGIKQASARRFWSERLRFQKLYGPWDMICIPNL